MRSTLAPCALFAFLLFCATDIDDNYTDEIWGHAAKTAYEYFVEILAIPRCTYNEEAASNHLVEFGRVRGFEVFQDEIFNVLIKKGGSKGREHEPPVILQAHIDMVCRKDGDVDHDFGIDPIVPVITHDGWITAEKRTTLGADNGGGVSMIMAILASSRISHPPVEALFTTQEETGLHGADFFDISRLNGPRLINLDMTDEGVFVVSSKWDDGPVVVIPLEPEVLAKIARLPDWHFRADSPLRDTMTAVFRNFYGKDPILAGINNRVAGVECLVFANRMPDVDMISIGSDIMNIHTPNERMSLSSFNRVYDFLVKVLEAL
ncbi:MAG: M20/M25/M40 family metallo-hydrolase [Chitinispirillales bacterium]|jgi:di/tripeptidase|nr:M20/M25/M40 family metallo-hydrolase [Chitinispirillales bacterium]